MAEFFADVIARKPVCLADPTIEKSFCDDRLPVCQNACDVCATTYP